MYKNSLNPLIAYCKRFIDVLFSLLLLIMLLPLIAMIALLVKLDSKGPIFFSQRRIGLATFYYISIFKMYKFRTMALDAEKDTGAVWASAKDNRVTRVGHLLRKLRLDELPQLINVLLGDMSLIGPRPERPEFYLRLENKIPFYVERTFYVLPGITGWAQVNQGYDSCIGDVRRKVGFDHGYAVALHNVIDWLIMDFTIVIKTLVIMIKGRGR